MKTYKLNFKQFLTVVILLLTSHLVSAQFVIKQASLTAQSVSNDGKVSGYTTQTGPYSIWLPDSGNVMYTFGGIGPGQGVGGRARFSEDGNFLCGTSMGINGPEMSRFDRSTGQWTTLGGLGFQIDFNTSSAWAISGDGNTVAGSAYADTANLCGHTHAVAWNATEGLIDLGSLYDNDCRSTRANAVSQDGSVIVGWQDFNGPWKAAVWRKLPHGGYAPNEFILLNPDSSPTDEYNRMGECSAVSSDGKWIGGYGSYSNNNEPWIWSEATGVIQLGNLPNLGKGNVSGISADGSVVVGWFDALIFGDVRVPFIWTPTGGLRELNEYMHTNLGVPVDNNSIWLAQCLSPDGHYIAGFGKTNGMSYFVFRLSLELPTAIKEKVKADDVLVYPNPATDLVTIKNKGKATLTITNMIGGVAGKVVMNNNYVLDISRYAPGVYILSFQSGDVIQTKKLIKS